MGKGFAKKKKQMRQLQSQIEDMQAQMADKKVTGTAGNGLVEVTLNGNQELEEIKINPDCVDPEDVEGLEDLIKEAFRKANEQLQSGMNEMGLPQDIPGMPGMPDLGFNL